MTVKSLKNKTVNSWFKWLIIWFAFTEIIIIYTYLINPIGLKALFPQTQQWEYNIRGVISILGLIFLYGIWKLKKWAVYAFGTTIVFSYFISILTGQIFGTVVGLALLTIFYLKGVKPIWKNFK